MWVETVESDGEDRPYEQGVAIEAPSLPVPSSDVGMKALQGRRTSWEATSACGRSRTGVTPWHTTVLTCVPCRLKNECLDDALENEMRGRVVMGVAGGLTQSERRSVLRLAASNGITLGSLTA